MESREDQVHREILQKIPEACRACEVMQIAIRLATVETPELSNEDKDKVDAGFGAIIDAKCTGPIEGKNMRIKCKHTKGSAWVLKHAIIVRFGQ